MKRKAAIHLELPSEKLLGILLKSLLPEAKKSVTSRAKVRLKGEGKIFTIIIEAEDTGALRATLNSYLRWVAVVKDTYEATANMERSDKN